MLRKRTLAQPRRHSLGGVPTRKALQALDDGLARLPSSTVRSGMVPPQPSTSTALAREGGTGSAYPVQVTLQLRPVRPNASVASERAISVAVAEACVESLGTAITASVRIEAELQQRRTAITLHSQAEQLSVMAVTPDSFIPT